MRRTYLFRLYPNQEQAATLDGLLETHRRLYNEFLEWRQFAYQVYGVTLTTYDLRNWARANRHGNPWRERLNASSVYYTAKRVADAYAAFFAANRARQNSGPACGPRPRPPRFIPRGLFDSLTSDNGWTWRCGMRHLRVQGVGHLRILQHRPLPPDARVKVLTLAKRERAWYAAFSCELPDPPAAPATWPAVGIDVGLLSFLVTSEGQDVPNPRWRTSAERLLRRINRSLSRKRLRSAGWKRVRLKLRRLHAAIARRRRDFHRKVAFWLCSHYRLIAVEDLNIRGLAQSRLARSVTDAGWRSFFQILRHTAERCGVQVVAVNPAGTSQLCSGCGALAIKDLSERTHHCPACGLTLGRDHNAARNVLKRALARTEPVGANGGNGPHARGESLTPTKRFPMLKSEALADGLLTLEATPTCESGGDNR